MMSLKSRATLLRGREKLFDAREMMMIVVERRKKGKGDLKQGVS